MRNLYFFKSSSSKDELSTLTVFSSSAKKAYALAVNNFNKNGYKGVPVMIAL